jgi:hypothetical protein
MLPWYSFDTYYKAFGQKWKKYSQTVRKSMGVAKKARYIWKYNIPNILSEMPYRNYFELLPNTSNFRSELQRFLAKWMDGMRKRFLPNKKNWDA